MRSSRTWSAEDEVYLVTHWRRTRLAVVGAHLGRTEGAIKSRLMSLRARYRAQGNAEMTELLYPDSLAVEPLRVIDGYPDVPWWCRITNRSQKELDLFTR